MKHRVIIPLVILCVVMAFMAGNLYAQEETSSNRRIGSAAGAELMIPVGGRDMAMGGSSIATTIGVESIYWNPAGLARFESSTEAMVSTMAYIADIKVNYGAVAVKFGTFGTVGISAKILDFGDIPLTTNLDPEALTGRTFSPNFMTLALSYARRFTDAITVGVNFKVITEQMGRATGSGTAVDLGIQYHGAGGIEGLDFGLVLKNYGPQMSFGGSGLLRQAVSSDGLRPEQYYQSVSATYELPSTLEIGLSYTRDFSEDMFLTVNSAFVNDNLALNAYRFGGEFGYKLDQISLFARGGYEYVPGEDINEYLFGPSFGMGIAYNTPGVDVMVDYCYRQTEYFDNNSMISLRFGF
jgi:hypothetical protein